MTYITHAEAAEILSCGVSNIPKLIRAGHLTSRGRGRHSGSLRLGDVEQLAARRAQDAAERERRQTTASPAPVDPRPAPVDGRGWITPVEAADIIGITPQAIRKRCRRGTLPHLEVAGRWWIREDHARLAGHVRATDGPEAVAFALRGL